MKWVHLSVLVAVIVVYYYQVYLLYSNTGTGSGSFVAELSNKLGKKLTEKSAVKSSPDIDVLQKGSPKLASNSYLQFKMGKRDRSPIGTENATLLMLVRNEELEGALSSMRSLEDRFNKDYRYPWVFLNDEPFDDEFIEQTTLMASGETFYELIPEEDWEPPEFIDEVKLRNNLKKSAKDGVIYGGMRSYRNMCHFNSGLFARQKKLLEYDWYFRVEPDVEHLCDFQYDPFKFLRENNQIYGFVTAILEYENTIPTLWQTVENFMKEFPHLIHPNNSLEFITSRETDVNQHVPMVESSTRYNLCHFWSNFEIANLNFWRSAEYLEYFDYLDKSGGFYYERWGDAPVHSIGLNILADKNRIHHFDDLGYYHPPYMACPTSKDLISQKRCICRTSGIDGEVLTEPYDIQMYSCLGRWWRYGSGKKFMNEVSYTFGNG